MNDREEALGRILDELTEFVRAGNSIDVAEAAARHPEFAADIEELLPSMLAIERIDPSRSKPITAASGFRLNPQEVIGDYEVVRELGHGGMGIVYEARQISLSRRVALKVLPPSVFTDEHHVSRFQQEAETASRLHHPNIVPIFAVGEARGVHFYSMQLIEGRTVDQLIETPTLAADFHRFARIGLLAARAIDHAHRHGVLHRDVKPSNLLVDESDNTWVADFGIAKTFEPHEPEQLDEFVGTMRYAAPEQLHGRFDVTSDVYALGMTLFELLTGHPAREVASSQELLELTRTGAVHAPADIDPRIPRDLSAIVAKATAPDRAQRYATAAELADDLDRFVDHRPVRARRITSMARAWRWSVRNPVASASAALAAVAILAASVFGWFAYLSASDALERERTANSRALDSLAAQQAATERAEANLARSLRAFDDLFDAIAGRDRELLMVDESDSDAPRLSTLTEKDLGVLERLLEFYDEFASGNAKAPRLGLDRARALRRIGDIHRWLGDSEAAAAGYRQSIEAYEAAQRMDWEFDIVDLALVHKNLGHALADAADHRGARTCFDTAEQLLRDQGKDSFRACYELARVYNAMAATTGRRMRARAQQTSPRGRPTGRAAERGRGRAFTASVDGYYRRALKIATELADEHPTNPELRLLMARSNRGLAQTRSWRGDASTAHDSALLAVDELEELAETFAEVPDYEQELVELYDLLAVLGTDPEERESFGKLAVEHARGMIEKFGALPQFADLLSRSLRNHACTLCDCAKSAERDVAAATLSTADAAFTESATLREELWQRSPHAHHHLRELVLTRQRHAELEQARGNPAAARELLDSAIAQVTEFMNDRRGPRGFGISLRGSYEQLARVLDELGERELAGRARSRARARGRSRPRGRRSR